MIQIDFRDSSPIYEQIRRQILRMILAGVLKPDDKLPSVRELASSLAINPNTIQRAYRELETEGYIYKVSGRGSFVAKVNIKESPKKRELLEQFDKTVEELLFLQMTVQELKDRISQVSKHDRTGTLQKDTGSSEEGAKGGDAL